MRDGNAVPEAGAPLFLPVQDRVEQGGAIRGLSAVDNKVSKTFNRGPFIELADIGPDRVRLELFLQYHRCTSTRAAARSLERLPAGAARAIH